MQLAALRWVCVPNLQHLAVRSVTGNESVINCTIAVLELRVDVQTLDRKRSTYNVTLRRVGVTIVEMKSNKHYVFWKCICSLRYSACIAHAPYCLLWSVWLYSILRHNIVIGTIFEKKKFIEHKMCFDFLCSFVSNISYYQKNWARYDKKSILVCI